MNLQGLIDKLTDIRKTYPPETPLTVTTISPPNFLTIKVWTDNTVRNTIKLELVDQ